MNDISVSVEYKWKKLALSKALVSKLAFCYSSPVLYNKSEYSLCAHTLTEQSTLGCFSPNCILSAVVVVVAALAVVFAAVVFVVAAVVFVVAAVVFVVAALAVVFAAVVAV